MPGTVGAGFILNPNQTTAAPQTTDGLLAAIKADLDALVARLAPSINFQQVKFQPSSVYAPNSSFNMQLSNQNVNGFLYIGNGRLNVFNGILGIYPDYIFAPAVAFDPVQIFIPPQTYNNLTLQADVSNSANLVGALYVMTY